MRSLPFVLLSVGLLAGCGGGYIADQIGPTAGIIAPQLTRYGLDPQQTKCVGDRLASSLTSRQLRRLEQLAGAVTRGYFEAGRLTPRDLSYVATQVKDPKVPLELSRATEACSVAAQVIPPLEAPNVGTMPGASPTPDPAPPTAGPTGRAAWLNLGAAASGQSIAVDAASLEQDPPSRKGWFRLTNPGATGPTGLVYLLRIDCAAKTLHPVAQRKQDAAGAISDQRDYGPDEDGPLPIENGTVMEIAYLALCT